MATKTTTSPTRSSRSRAKATTVVRGSAWGNNPKFTVAQAAVALDLPLRSVYDHIKFGRLDHVELGGQLYVRQSHMDKFIAGGTKERS